MVQRPVAPMPAIIYVFDLLMKVSLLKLHVRI